jgi:hypothetical protein
MWPFSSKKKKEEVKHMTVTAEQSKKAAARYEPTHKEGRRKSEFFKCSQCGRKFFGRKFAPRCCGYLAKDTWDFMDYYLLYTLIDMAVGDPGYNTNTYVGEGGEFGGAGANGRFAEPNLVEQTFSEPRLVEPHYSEPVVHESHCHSDRTPSYEPDHSDSHSSGGYESSGGGDCGGGCDCGGGGSD